MSSLFSTDNDQHRAMPSVHEEYGCMNANECYNSRRHAWPQTAQATSPQRNTGTEEVSSFVSVIAKCQNGAIKNYLITTQSQVHLLDHVLLDSTTSLPRSNTERQSATTKASPLCRPMLTATALLPSTPTTLPSVPCIIITTTFLVENLEVVTNGPFTPPLLPPHPPPNSKS